MADLSFIFFIALLTALATGLGAIPLIWNKHIQSSSLGKINALVAGLMATASWLLIEEAFPYSLFYSVFGICAGIAFTYVVSKYIDHSDILEHLTSSGLETKKALLIVITMTVHSMAEGIGIGVSFGGGESLGIFISLALLLHNIPEGLAISLTLIPRGVSVLRAAWWSVFSSLPQPLLAIPAYLFVETFRPLLPVGLGFAAGAMIWMVLHELIPEAKEENSWQEVSLFVFIGIAIMWGLQWMLGR